MEPCAHNQRRVRVPLRKALCTHIHTRVGILVRERSLNVSHYLQKCFTSLRSSVLFPLLRFTCDCSSISSAWVMPATTVYGLPPRSRLLVSNRDKVGVLYIYS